MHAQHTPPRGPLALPSPNSTQQEILDIAYDCAEEPEQVMEAIRVAGRCSMWKAALRLRAWNFTREFPASPEALEDEDSEEDEEGEFWKSRWIQSRARFSTRSSRRMLADSAYSLADDISKRMSRLILSSTLGNPRSSQGRSRLR
jgi:hypothetical protein